MPVHLPALIFKELTVMQLWLSDSGKSLVEKTALSKALTHSVRRRYGNRLSLSIYPKH